MLFVKFYMHFIFARILCLLITVSAVHGSDLCPANSSPTPGANNSQGCTCDSGYYGPPEGPCELCPANSWCSSAVQTLCPLETPISPAGASRGENCTCVAGEYCKFPEEPINRQVDVSSYAVGWCYIDVAEHGLHCWGPAFEGWYVGEPGTMHHIPLPPGRHAIDVGVGTFFVEGDRYTHACVHLDDLTVKCWGSNVGNMLGSGYTSNSTRLNTTDEVRANGGLKFAPNSLVYANSMRDALFCGLHAEDHTMVTCWGTSLLATSSYGVTKYFPAPVRGLFIYAYGFFAVLEDNSVYQWGDYEACPRVVGDGTGGAQTFRRWYPTEQVRSVVSVGARDVCFHFLDGNFSCVGQHSHSLDVSGASDVQATPFYFPSFVFRTAGGGSKVKYFEGSTWSAYVLARFENDELRLFRYSNSDTLLSQFTLMAAATPSNPVIKTITVFTTSKQLIGAFVCYADGLWSRRGNTHELNVGAVNGKRMPIPLLEYGMPDMDECACTSCDSGFFCPGGGHRQECPSGGGTDPALGSVDESSCLNLGNPPPICYTDL